MLSLPPMRTLSHPLHSGSLFPLFWLPLLPCCTPPPCLLCTPLSLLVWLPRSVCLCCSSPCLWALLVAPVAHPLLSPPPAPPYEDFTSLYGVDCPVRGWLVTALLPPPVVGTSRRAGRSPRPCGVRGHLVEGGGGGCLLMARSACAAFGGCCSARTSWFPCVLLCVLLGLVSLPCVGRLCAQLLCCPPPPPVPLPPSGAYILKGALRQAQRGEGDRAVGGREQPLCSFMNALPCQEDIRCRARQHPREQSL